MQSPLSNLQISATLTGACLLVYCAFPGTAIVSVPVFFLAAAVYKVATMAPKPGLPAFKTPVGFQEILVWPLDPQKLLNHQARGKRG